MNQEEKEVTLNNQPESPSEEDLFEDMDTLDADLEAEVTEEPDLFDPNDSLYSLNELIDGAPRLSAEEELRYGSMVQAAKALSAGDRSPEAVETFFKAEMAKKVMVESNLRLVRFFARKVSNRGVQMDDLFQEGVIGLMEAVDNFKPAFGNRFSTYAAYGIKQKMKRLIQAQRQDLRLPLAMQDLLTKIHGTQSFLIQQLEANPTAMDIAVCIALGNKETAKVIQSGIALASLAFTVNFGELTPQIIEDALKVNAPVVSLDKALSEDDDRDLIETILVDAEKRMSAWEYQDLCSILKELMGILDERQTYVLVHCFGLGGAIELTLEEIGRVIGVGRERTRQIREEALEALRSSPASAVLFAYVG